MNDVEQWWIISVSGGMAPKAPRIAVRGRASSWMALLCALHSVCGLQLQCSRDVRASSPINIKSPRSAFVVPVGGRAGCRSRCLLHRRMAEEAFDEAHSREGTTHYHLTVVLPAWDERERIGDTLSSYIRCLSETPVWCQHREGYGEEGGARKEQYTSGSASFLVVDDGSTDDTADFVRGNSWRQHAAITEKEGCWKVDESVACISLPHNSGKGAAIERGMMELPSMRPEHISAHSSSVRSVVLVADADGSGDISCIGPMLQRLEELLAASDTASGDRALVVGYRQYPEAKSPLRSLLSWGFRTCVSLIFLGSDLGVRDTQCGFKLMTVSTGEALYKNLNLRRWTQDVEVIHRAKLLGVPIGECGVSWVDQPGSKLVTKASDAVIMSAVMLGEIATMRAKYAMGAWKVDADE